MAQAGHMVGVPVRQDDEIEIGEINALCFHVGGKRLTVIAGVELNSLAGDLNERGEAPILLHRWVRAEGVVQDRDLGLGSGGRSVTAVKRPRWRARPRPSCASF